MIASHRLRLPQFGFNGNNAENLKQHGGWGAFLLGVLFAMAFCPTSGMFYFGMLIPMSATTTMGYLLPAVFATATALPVIIVAWLLAFSMQKVGRFYGWLKNIERWATIIVSILFIMVGLYECYIIYFLEKIYPKGPENGRTVQMNCESVGSDFQAIWQKILKRQVYANFGQSSVTKTLPSPLKARIGKSGNE